MTGHCQVILINRLAEAGARLSGGRGTAGTDRRTAGLIDPDPDLTQYLGAGVTGRFPGSRTIGGWGAIRINRSGVLQARIGNVARSARPAERTVVDVLDAPVNATSVVFTGGGLVSYLIAGPVFAADVNIRYGSRVGLPVRADLQVSPDGAAFIPHPTPRRVAHIEWPRLSAAEASEFWQGVVFAQERQSPVAVSLYHGAGGRRADQSTFVGWITEAIAPQSVAPGRWRAGLTITEIAG